MEHCQCKIERPTNLIFYIFLISLTVFEIEKKNCFWKKVCRGLGVAKTS